MKTKQFFFITSFFLAFYLSPILAQETGHIHHTHLNVSSVDETSTFYQNAFGVVPIDYNNAIPALLMERSFLLMEEIPQVEIKDHLLTGLFHISWSTSDGESEYNRLKNQGVEFYRPLTPLVEDSTYMYLFGPDREVIEIFDLQKHHRFNHIHQLATPESLEETAQWFYKNLNLKGEMARGEGFINLAIDNIAFSIFEIGARFTPEENTGTLEKTDGSQLDHLAFSFRELDVAFERIKSLGSVIEQGISVDEKYGFRHFYSRAPNGVLVEFVEAKPWPEAAWEN